MTTDLTPDDLDQIQARLDDPPPLVRAVPGGFVYTDDGTAWLRAMTDAQCRLLAEVRRLLTHNTLLVTEVRFQAERADQTLVECRADGEALDTAEDARAKYDAEEVTVNGDVYRRRTLPGVLGLVMKTRDENARERDGLAAKLAAVREWTVSEPRHVGFCDSLNHNPYCHRDSFTEAQKQVARALDGGEDRD